jgi:EpsI family protein
MNLIAWRFPITALFLVGTIAALKWSDQPRPQDLIRPLESIQPRIAGWTMTGSNRLSEGVAGRLDATTYLSREYRKDGQSVSLFIAYYAQQRAGESMHSPRNCLPGSGWEILRRETAEIGFWGRPAKINNFSIQNAGQHMLVYYWYQSRHRIVANEYMGKILLVRDAFIDGQTGGSIVRVIAPDTPKMATEVLAFAAAVEQQVQACFGR